MREVEAKDQANTLESLLDHVEAGEEIVIVRDGRRVARLVGERPQFDREEARRAAAELLAASKGKTLGGLTIRELIDEGRR